MKNLFGSPGRVSGLVMRVLQCLFASASVGIMVSSSGFSTSTAFCYLIVSMGIQFLWSFALACLDMHALRIKKDLQNHLLVSLFAVGDWVTSILSLAAACSSAGVVVLYAKDTKLCKDQKPLNCEGFQIAIVMAFVSWFLLAISSHVMFWLMASS
uniref:CASP-like protein n=1 Tax=Kalanchoe fedtschenkoi TaxID=63787 RepID=A0A7N0V4Q6_KALFE